MQNGLKASEHGPRPKKNVAWANLKRPMVRTHPNFLHPLGRSPPADRHHTAA
jgi:hypothetical protein